MVLYSSEIAKSIISRSNNNNGGNNGSTCCNGQHNGNNDSYIGDYMRRFGYNPYYMDNTMQMYGYAMTTKTPTMDTVQRVLEMAQRAEMAGFTGAAQKFRLMAQAMMQKISGGDSIPGQTVPQIPENVQNNNPLNALSSMFQNLQNMLEILDMADGVKDGNIDAKILQNAIKAMTNDENPSGTMGVDA